MIQQSNPKIGHYKSFHGLVIVKPYGYKGLKKAKGVFFLDDYPFLLKLVPIGTQVKRRYKEVLNNLFIKEETSDQMLALLWEVWNLSEKNNRYNHIVVRCHKPLGQNVLVAFNEFLEDVMPSFEENVVNATKVQSLNSEGSRWIDNLDVEDAIVKPSDEEVDGRTTPFHQSAPMGLFKENDL